MELCEAYEVLHDMDDEHAVVAVGKAVDERQRALGGLGSRMHMSLVRAARHETQHTYE